MPGIFISYRRTDVPGQAGRLFERLAAHYGEDFVFMDVESIDPSQQFETVILDRIKDCDLMLLAIGPSWELRDQGTGKDTDYVLMELLASRKASRRLCPLLIDRTQDLEADRLPDDVKDIVKLQSFELRHKAFDRDVGALIHGLERLGIKPPRNFARRRIESALMAAGPPYSWVAGLSRVLTPIGFAVLTLIMLAATGFLAHGQGVKTGIDRAERAYSAEHQLERATEERQDLRIHGRVADGDQHAVEGASVRLTNRTNQKTTTARTDSNGVYFIDLGEIGIANEDIVSIEIVKESFRPLTETVQYRSGFRQFRNTLRR